MTRAEFSRKTKAAAWERSGGLCEGSGNYYDDRVGDLRCCAPLDHGCFHYDHIDPTWTSDRNDLENCQVLCVPCHKEKTRKDQGDIAKVKRIKDKRIKAKTSRNPMPFGKGSKWKKKISGKVVRR